MNAKIVENIDMSAVADFCRRWHINEMSLFGSVLRDDFTEDSDVDVVVDIEDEYALGKLGRLRAEKELSALFGRKTEIVDKDTVMWWRTLPSVRNSILGSAEVIYAHP